MHLSHAIISGRADPWAFLSTYAPGIFGPQSIILDLLLLRLLDHTVTAAMDETNSLFKSNHMERLPTEVVCEILGHSDLKEIKLIRMAFARSPYGAPWIETGANLLFKQIYFSIGPQAMLRFQNVTETKRLQKCVRHLVFVDTQLNERLVEDQDSFLSTLSWAGTMPRSQADRTYHTYCRVFKEWQKILDDGKDVALLIKGLGALPNVNTVSIIGGPSHDPGTVSYLENGPHAADLDGVGLRPSYWTYRSRQSPRYHQFDRRPFQNLLRSLCAAKVRPIKVELGNWLERSNGNVRRMGVPVSCLNLYCGLGNAMFNTVISTAFANVTDLNLQVDMNPRPYDPDPVYTQRDLSFLFEFQENTWMALEFLSLRAFEISPATFTAFIKNHNITLTEISLDQVGLPSGCRDTWAGLLSRNKPLLHLKGAKLQVYEVETPDDGSEDHVWIDEDLLLNLLFENQEDKDEKEGKTEERGDVMEN